MVALRDLEWGVIRLLFITVVWIVDGLLSIHNLFGIVFSG
jgi:hypothetical protein